MIFKAKAKLEKGFLTTSKSNNNEYVMDVSNEKDGPMDIFAVAFSSCVIMCAKGYFYRKYELVDLLITTDLSFDYDNRKCDIIIKVDKDLTKEDIEGIKENIKLRCKVSHILSKDIEINYIIE